MDNLGDWLYIIMVLIAIVSGLFSGKKKKKNQTDVLGQPGYDETEDRPTNEKSFWEMFEETVAGDAQSTTSAPEPVPQIDKPIQKRKKKNKVVSEKVTARKSENTSPFLQGEFTGYGNNSISGTVRGSILSEEQYTSEEETFHDLDELKKAIIYTEILNRKY